MSESNLHAAVFTLGIVLLSAGAWMAWRPLGLIVPGALLLCGLIAVRMRSVPVVDEPKE